MGWPSRSNVSGPGVGGLPVFELAAGQPIASDQVQPGSLKKPYGAGKSHISHGLQKRMPKCATPQKTTTRKLGPPAQVAGGNKLGIHETSSGGANMMGMPLKSTFLGNHRRKSAVPRGRKSHSVGRAWARSPSASGALAGCGEAGVPIHAKNSSTRVLFSKLQPSTPPPKVHGAH